MNSKYEMLVQALDNICKDAPTNFSSYNLDNLNDENKDRIRAKAYIHLFLFAKFGIQKFIERHNYITDGAQDGGIDAFYIDRTSKIIYIIQSKYRTSQENYENKELNPGEVVSMDVKRILDGEKMDCLGIPYNGHICRLQETLANL